MLDPFIALATRIELGYIAPENQQRFFGEMNNEAFKGAENRNFMGSELN